MTVPISASGAAGTSAVVIVPYRGTDFLARYGPVVRDWGFIRALADHSLFDGRAVYVVERPRRPGVRARADALRNLRIRATLIETGYLNPFAALARGRRFSERPVRSALQSLFAQHQVGLLVDFDPFSRFEVPSGWSHWIDEIDDFSLHHRLPPRDRRAAREKQSQPCTLRTFSDALGSRRGVAAQIPNFPFQVDSVRLSKSGDLPKHLFGFVGFVADKTDLEFVRMLSRIGSVGVWGKVVDRPAGKKLSSIPNVSIYGEYVEANLPEIMASFSHGVIPFDARRIHGNSPIKAFLYSAFGKRVISTAGFGLNLSNVLVATHEDEDVVRRFLSAAVDWRQVESELYRGRDELFRCFIRLVGHLDGSRSPV